MRAWFAPIALLLCSTIAACGSGSDQACEVDNDCASHFCKADGTCGVAETDAGTGDATADGTSNVCVPNHDGVITLAEMPFAAGRMGTFRVATDATWDTTGAAVTGGGRRWD